MQRILYSAALAAASAVISLSASGAVTPVFENTGQVDTPVVDAETVINRGIYNISAFGIPYDTQNTLNFTNLPGAVFTGGDGIQFSLVGDDGIRSPAANFYNAGAIQMNSVAGSFGVLIFGSGVFGSVPNNSWVLIDATNVVNRGGLSVGAQGLLRIDGQNVQLSRSGLRAGEDPTAPINQGAVFEPFYSNDTGVQDLYAGAGVNNALDPATPGPFRLQVLSSLPGSSGPHEVLLPSGFTNRVNVSAPVGFALTNTVSPTNLVIQAILVDTNSFDPQFKVAARWGAPRNPSVQGAQMAMVQFTFEDVDTITGEPFTNYVYVLDNLGAMTNAVFLTNSANPTLQRPSSFVVTRVTPPEWDAGVGTNVVYDPALLVSPDYAGTDVTNVYAAYSANIGTATRTSPTGGTIFGGIPALTHPTNLPGRIEVNAGTLDLNLSRFRSEGLLSIQADQLNPGPPYKLDSAIVKLDVGSTNGPLLVSNIVQTTVRRFSGRVNCWSGAWTNQAFTTGPDPNDATLTVTNTIEIRFHVLIVQDNFQTIVPVQTLGFTAHSVEATIVDNLSIRDSFQIDAPVVDIQSAINVGGLPITPANFPSLVSLTNSGSLDTFEGVQIGTSAAPIDYFLNAGSLSGSTLDLNVMALENSGSLTSGSGDIALNTRDLKMEGGQASAAANLRVRADDFKAQMSTIETGTGTFGALVLDVKNRLTDGGAIASNAWFVTDGFQLLSKPAEGDLLGTHITSFLNRFREGVHVWSADDKGPTIDGFTNNSCIGWLTLDGTPFTLFTFRGPDAVHPYALYVDYLELTNAVTNDIAASLNIATNFTLYFADASVPPDQLDGALNGRLRWIQAQAGEFSGVDVSLASGGTVRVNRAVLRSTTLDSDGDGVPNVSDPAPFESAALRVNVRFLDTSPAQAEISWIGGAGGGYEVQYSSALGGEWKTLTTCDNAQAGSQPMSVCDSAVNSAETRFYRVIQVR